MAVSYAQSWRVFDQSRNLHLLVEPMGGQSRLASGVPTTWRRPAHRLADCELDLGLGVIYMPWAKRRGPISCGL